MKIGIFNSQAAKEGEKEIQEGMAGGNGTRLGWKENAHSGQVRPRGDVWALLHLSCAGSATRRLCWARTEGSYTWHWILCVDVQVCVSECAYS